MSRFWKFALCLALVLQTAWSTAVAAARSADCGCTWSVDFKVMTIPASNDPNCTGTFQVSFKPTCSLGYELGCQPIYVGWHLFELDSNCNPTGNRWDQIRHQMVASAGCDGIEGPRAYDCWTPYGGFLGFGQGNYILEADFFNGPFDTNWFDRVKIYARCDVPLPASPPEWTLPTSPPAGCPPL